MLFSGNTLHLLLLTNKRLVRVCLFLYDYGNNFNWIGNLNKLHVCGTQFLFSAAEQQYFLFHLTPLLISKSGLACERYNVIFVQDIFTLVQIRQLFETSSHLEAQ